MLTSTGWPPVAISRWLAAAPTSLAASSWPARLDKEPARLWSSEVSAIGPQLNIYKWPT